MSISFNFSIFHEQSEQNLSTFRKNLRRPVDFSEISAKKYHNKKRRKGFEQLHKSSKMIQRSIL